MSANLEQKRKNIEAAVKVAALIAVGFFVSPFVFIAIKGILGIIVAGTISLMSVNLAPSVAALVANWRLKALKAVAAANPIETLENQYADRQAALLKIRDNIKQSYAVLQGLGAQIKEHNEKYPGSPSQFADKYDKLKSLIDLRGRKYKQAQLNLVAFSELLDEKRSDWKIAQTMAEASKLANVGQDFQSKLMQDTALTTVQDGLNLAFSELETSLLDEQSSPPPSVTVVKPAAARVQRQLGPSPLDLDFESDNVIDAETVPVQSARRKTA